MIRISKPLLAALLSLAVTILAFAQAKKPPATPAQGIHDNFEYVTGKILEMAKDWPAEKYDYRPGPGLRSFGEIMVHVTGGNGYAAKAGRGEQVNWDELDPKNYKTKAEIVAVLEKSIADATATLKATPDDRFTKTLSPWVAVIEHAGEHYGQLVVYYRN